MNALVAVIAVIVILGLIFLAASIKIVQEYERGVIFRLGRSQGAKGPGVFFIIPVVDRLIRTNLQIIAVPVTSQAVITKDNVTATVDAVAYFQVVDAAASVIQVRDWYAASQLVAQTTLRSIVGRHELDQLLRSATASTPSCRSRWTPRRRRGGSRSTGSRFVTSACPSRCSGRWLGRRRPSGSGGPRSSPPTVSCRLRRSSPRRPT